MNSEIEPETPEAPQQATAVSIFGQNGGSNDFPVLKAFQEYIDAEQAKARKRMVGLAAFFIVLLVVVVVTFTLIMTAFISRNQALSDKLLDIALHERSQPQGQPPVVNVQQPQPIVQQPSQETILKPVLEQIEKLASAMTKSQQATPPPVVVTTAPAQPTVAAMPASETVETIRLREELRKQQEELKAQQKKLQDAIHQAEVEKHRRRLYPEYYEQQEQVEMKPQPLPKALALTPMGDIKRTKPINYFETTAAEDEELNDLLRKAKPKTSTTASKTSSPATRTVAKPVKTETLNVGVSDSNSIPWLIELPKK